MDKHTDVLVIGGGFAGVTAARELGSRGHTVTILEARDRLGGRTWYERNRIAGFDVEMGGGWLGDDEVFAMAEVDRYSIALLRDEGVPQHLLWRSTNGVRQGVLPVPFDQLADLERAVLRMNQAASRIPRTLFDDPATLADLHDLEVPLPQLFEDLQLPAETQGVLEGFWSGISSAHWSQMSALHAARLIAASGSTFMGFMGTVMLGPRFANGTGELIDAMVADSGAQVDLGTVVSMITQRAEGVAVETNRGTYHATAVICAVPLTTLGSITFEPGLDETKSAAIAAGHPGQGFKLWMVAKNAGGGVFGLGAPGPFHHLFTVDERDDLALLVGFGDAECPDVTDLDLITTMLREYLPDADVVAADAHDWHEDPYSQGTWAIYPAGYTTRFEEALTRPHGAVAFAGADISHVRPGYIDGAIASGIEAAATVTKFLDSTR